MKNTVRMIFCISISSQTIPIAPIWRNKENGAWTWSDGETFSYTNWASGEPNDQSDSEAYAMFYFKYTDGTWNDGDGSLISEGNGNNDCPFICEWDS